MDLVVATVLIGVTVVFALMISLMAQAQNATLPHNTNNTKQIVNVKDRTITLVNTTTNETISVKPIPETTGNMTANETVSGTAANMTANETVSGTAANMTANDSLTEKFRELGK